MQPNVTTDFTDIQVNTYINATIMKKNFIFLIFFGPLGIGGGFNHPGYTPESAN